MDDQLSLLGESTARHPEKKKTRGVARRINQPAKPPDALEPDSFNNEKIYKKIISGLRKFFNKNEMKRACVGVSGGVDSALTLKLAVDALGSENITGLIMPELGVTNQENTDHAKALCSFLKVEYFYCPINTFLTDYGLLPWKPNKTANMNARARIRMSLLYNYSNTHDTIVLGTSNKSELLLGYGTKHGDLACDVEVIGGLLKTEVIALADALGLPPEITHKTPTAELAVGQTDETELGAPYAQLDLVLAKAGLGMDKAIEHGLPATMVHNVFRRINKNAHKTSTPPVIPIK